MNEKIEIRSAQLPEEIKIIEKLWVEYLTWGNEKMQKEYGVHPHNPVEAVEHDIKMIDKFLPPQGRLLLAFTNNAVCGIGCLKSIDSEIGEIKRMYVDPTFRKMGVGKAILESLITEAKVAGYKKIRLDSIKFMEAAHALYRSFEFVEIPVYPEVEISEEFRKYLLFMELDLSSTTRDL